MARVAILKLDLDSRRRQDGSVLRPVPVSKPLLPSFRRLEPYLRRIDAARHYSNHGALWGELRARLAAHFGLAAEHLTLAGSGTAALTGAILAAAGRARPERPLCLCPSYTFVATAAAAEACGYTPYFIDIDAHSWATSPRHVLAAPVLQRAGLILPAAPYGRPVDYRAWETLQAETKIPVIIDAAGCFDTVAATQLGNGAVPVAISLHATKTFSTAEGGLVICGDAELMQRCERALNFGFHGSRDSVGPSINGKLSEYHAAVGLAELDGWTEKRAGFLRAARLYRELAAAKGLAPRLMADGEHASVYALYVAAGAEAAGTAMAALQAHGAEYRLWYGKGIHRQPQYRDCPRGRLAVTEDLAPRAIGLPMAPDLDVKSIDRVVEALSHTQQP